MVHRAIYVRVKVILVRRSLAFVFHICGDISLDLVSCYSLLVNPFDNIVVTVGKGANLTLDIVIKFIKVTSEGHSVRLMLFHELYVGQIIRFVLRISLQEFLVCFLAFLIVELVLDCILLILVYWR